MVAKLESTHLVQTLRQRLDTALMFRTQGRWPHPLQQLQHEPYHLCSDSHLTLQAVEPIVRILLPCGDIGLPFSHVTISR